MILITKPRTAIIAIGQNQYFCHFVNIKSFRSFLFSIRKLIPLRVIIIRILETFSQFPCCFTSRLEFFLLFLSGSLSCALVSIFLIIDFPTSSFETFDSIIKSESNSSINERFIVPKSGCKFERNSFAINSAEPLLRLVSFSKNFILISVFFILKRVVTLLHTYSTLSVPSNKRLLNMRYRGIVLHKFSRIRQTPFLRLVTFSKIIKNILI
jgi:hypothetical protein